MLKINPKYTWREWLIVPAYEQASRGDYSLIQQIQAVLNQPYEEQTQAIEDQYYRLRPDCILLRRWGLPLQLLFINFCLKSKP